MGPALVGQRQLNRSSKISRNSAGNSRAKESQAKRTDSTDIYE